MNPNRILRRAHPHILLLATLLAAACGGEAEGPTPAAPRADAGLVADAAAAAPPADAGAALDAGLPPVDAGGCPEGYTGDRCDRCAPGWQDGDGDGVCSLACDATGADAPQCGQGQCYIDVATDTRACRCDAGHVGAACDACDVGYADPDEDGVCTRACQLDCGSNGRCEIAADDSESCACDEGYEGALCDACAPGYAARRTSCVLDLPLETELSLWLDADAPSSLRVSQSNPADGVQTWLDRRGGDTPTLAAPDAARRPVYIPGALNGRAVVRFDGVDDRLTLNGIDAFGGADYTVFVLVEPHTHASGGVFTASQTENGVAVALDLYNPGSGARFIHRIPGMANTEDMVQSAAFRPQQPHLVAVRRWTSGLLDFIRMYGADGGDVMGIQVDDATLSVGNLGGFLRFTLGTGVAGDPLGGDVAELLVYRRALEDVEMRAVLEYLAAKWGVE